MKKIWIFVILAALLIDSTVSAGDSEGKGMQTPKSSDSVAASRSTSNKAEGVELNLNYIDAPLLDIVWCGDDDKQREGKETLFVLTNKGTVYNSNDLGKTWNKLRETFLKTGKKNATDVDNVYRFYHLTFELIFWSFI